MVFILLLILLPPIIKVIVDTCYFSPMKIKRSFHFYLTKYTVPCFALKKLLVAQIKRLYAICIIITTNLYILYFFH